ncbi:MAG TPA: hypothetical protein VHT71_23815, partial [Methylomirabilota bacterium]|nr:hypothetical protein [Methylomirabilota bacterium]
MVALGTFDGVHLGHRAILGTALTRAREAGLDAVACTFDPHPMEVLQPERAPRPISPLAERLAVIGDTGIDAVVVLPFTRELAAIEPEAFVKDVLLDRLRAREVVVGYNHRFGRGARGDAGLLESLAGRLGFRAHVVPAMTVDGVAVSSSEIRAALQPLQAQVTEVLQKVVVPLLAQLSDTADLIVGACAAAKLSGGGDKLKELCAQAKDVFAKAVSFLEDVKAKPAQLFTDAAGHLGNLKGELDRVLKQTGAAQQLADLRKQVSSEIRAALQPLRVQV